MLDKRITVVYRIFQRGLTEKLTFEQTNEADESARRAMSGEEHSTQSKE